MRRFVAFLALALCVAACPPATAAAQHNVILFVPDGLRSVIVDETTAPTLAELRKKGVDFANGHSLFPTVTTPNASAMATGHYLGDTGDFGNTIFTGFKVKAVAASQIPFLEQDEVIDEIDDHFGGNYLNEMSLIAAARAKGYSTAIVGKLGPAAIQDVTALRNKGTLIVDDDTGNGGLTLDAQTTAAFKAAGLSDAAPFRSVPNIGQQAYFADAVTKVLLTQFKAAGKPFFIVFWSRDPDGTQHAQTDKVGAVVPGINGPTSLAAIRNADGNLAAIRGALDALGLAATTNIVVSADHGFSTISKESATSSAIHRQFEGVDPGTLPRGFLAIDLAQDLHMPLSDPDRFGLPVELEKGFPPKNGNGFLGANKEKPDVVVAANGGADLIYLPQPNRKALAPKVVKALLKQDYVSGIFVADELGKFAGTLPTSLINLNGTALTPHPAIVVNFRSYASGCQEPLRCAVEVADTALLQGQGMHGSFSRADTFNFQAAIGPDFKVAFRDAAPTSNADIGMTIASLLHLEIPPKGKLVGRVVSEALAGGPEAVAFAAKEISSKPASNLRTVLRYQAVGTTLYFDAAGFPGRTVGVPADAP